MPALKKCLSVQQLADPHKCKKRRTFFCKRLASARLPVDDGHYPVDVRARGTKGIKTVEGASPGCGHVLDQQHVLPGNIADDRSGFA